MSFRPLPRKLDMVDRDMAKILREKTEAERLAIAFGMWRSARDILRNVLRSEHPDWTEARIKEETARRMTHGTG